MFKQMLARFAGAAAPAVSGRLGAITIPDFDRITPRKNPAGLSAVYYDPRTNAFVLVDPAAVAAGKPGNRLHAGQGAPPRSFGAEGDLYLDAAPGSLRLYGPKTAAGWGAGVVVVRPKGDITDDKRLTENDGVALSTARGAVLSGDAPD